MTKLAIALAVIGLLACGQQQTSSESDAMKVAAESPGEESDVAAPPADTAPGASGEESDEDSGAEEDEAEDEEAPE